MTSANPNLFLQPSARPTPFNIFINILWETLWCLRSIVLSCCCFFFFLTLPFFPSRWISHAFPAKSLTLSLLRLSSRWEPVVQNLTASFVKIYCVFFVLWKQCFFHPFQIRDRVGWVNAFASRPLTEYCDMTSFPTPRPNPNWEICGLLLLQRHPHLVGDHL